MEYGYYWLVTLIGFILGMGIGTFLENWKWNKLHDSIKRVKKVKESKSIYEFKDGLLSFGEEIEMLCDAGSWPDESEKLKYRLPKIVNGNFECGMCQHGVIEKQLTLKYLCPNCSGNPVIYWTEIAKKIRPDIPLMVNLLADNIYELRKEINIACNNFGAYAKIIISPLNDCVDKRKVKEINQTLNKREGGMRV